MTSSDVHPKPSYRNRLSPAELRFVNGTTDTVPPGVLTDHEMWLATEADAARLVKEGLCEVPEDAGLVRRGYIEDARFRLLEQLERGELASKAKPTRYYVPDSKVSERTLQRWTKQHVDEVRALMKRRRSGPQLSAASAGARARAKFTPETGMYHHRCAICRDPANSKLGKPFDSRRPDAKTCGPKCRKRLSTGATDPRRWLGDDLRLSPYPERQQP